MNNVIRAADGPGKILLNLDGASNERPLSLRSGVGRHIGLNFSVPASCQPSAAEFIDSLQPETP